MRSRRNRNRRIRQAICVIPASGMTRSHYSPGGTGAARRVPDSGRTGVETDRNFMRSTRNDGEIRMLYYKIYNKIFY